MPKKNGPPPRISDEQLGRLPGYRIERAIARHERYVEKVAAEDPGHGLAPVKAEPARQAQLETISREVGEIRRLDAALDRWSRSPERSESWTRRFRQANRSAIAAAHKGEPQKELNAMHEGLRELEREREAKKKLRELGEQRRAGPPDPRAASVTAAILSDGETYDLTKRKFRKVEMHSGTQVSMTTTAEPVLGPDDIVALYLVLHALEDRGEVTIRVSGNLGVWPAELELPPTVGLPSRLAHLARNGYFAIEHSGAERRVQYGRRTRRIAAKWDIQLRSAEQPSLEVTSATA